VSRAGRLSRARVWSGDLLNLEADTEYRYVVAAVDAAGNIRRETGTFRTLRRRIEVDFKLIHIIDDGEGFGAGNADARFEFLANTEPSVVLDYRGVTVPAVRTGANISGFSGPLASITIENAPTDLLLRVFGVEEDPKEPLEFGPPCCAVGGEGSSSAGGFTIGADFNDEWGRGSYTTGIWRTGPAEAYDEAFELDATYGDGFDFTVSGEFRVRYVP
jgi:hypothetical protein